MDPLLCILDTSVPKARQQCILKATKEAKAYKTCQTTDDCDLRDEKKAYNKGNTLLPPYISNTIMISYCCALEHMCLRVIKGRTISVFS